MILVKLATKVDVNQRRNDEVTKVFLAGQPLLLRYVGVVAFFVKMETKLLLEMVSRLHCVVGKYGNKLTMQ